MKVIGRVAAGAIVMVCGSMCGVGVAMALPAPDDGPTVNPMALEPLPDVLPSDVDPDPVILPSPLDHNWKCKWTANCPAGLVRTPKGNYAGCTSWTDISSYFGCTGQCVKCSGSTNPIKLCVPGLPSDSCVFVGGTGGAGQPVACGTKAYLDDCMYVATPPAGEPYATPNGCYCRGVATPTNEPCTLQPCNK